VVVFVIITGPWLLIYVGLLFEENPPKPKYTYGEFPFYLEYEINGKIINVEDTIIVKYNGIGLSEGTGKYIKWKQSLASGNKEVILLNDGDIKIKFPIMDSEHYINSDFKDLENNTIFPDAIREIKFGNGITTGIISRVELYEKYKIRLIKLEHSKPIRK